MTSGNEVETVRLDLNNPVFQRTLFNLTKNEQRAILNTLKKIAAMTWQQVYTNNSKRLRCRSLPQRHIQDLTKPF